VADVISTATSSASRRWFAGPHAAVVVIGEGLSEFICQQIRAILRVRGVTEAAVREYRG
jgi:hypothetical protein